MSTSPVAAAETAAAVAMAAEASGDSGWKVEDALVELPVPATSPEEDPIKEKESNPALVEQGTNEDGPATESKLPVGTGTRAREVRLDQNRKAARESRRRKKVMVDELQRSIIFFSRANSTLKQQNDELTRMILQAQSTIAQANDSVKAEEGLKQEGDGVGTVQAYQALPTANTGTNIPMFTSLPPMQPGATMQAMSNFQQAASIAMQQAMQGLQSIPGINLNQITAAPPGASPQQAYTDTMTAMAMQQAAMAAAAGHQYQAQQQQHHQQGFPPPPYNPFMWPGSAQQQQPMVAAPTANDNGAEEEQEAGTSTEAKQE